jgi:hypothetical protein
MLKGHLDAIKSSGYVEGWAYDAENILRPLQVSVCIAPDQEVAWGLAQRFRPDLMTAGIGVGWCAFRIRPTLSVRRLRNTALTLRDRTTGAELHRIDAPSYFEDVDSAVTSTDELVRSDPTVISDVMQLRGCDPVFSAYVKTRGVAAFVRTVYVYVLARPADDTGLSLYGGLIRKGALNPFELITILADSDEFRAKPRSLNAPNSPTFPFYS